MKETWGGGMLMTLFPVRVERGERNLQFFSWPWFFEEKKGNLVLDIFS